MIIWSRRWTRPLAACGLAWATASGIVALVVSAGALIAAATGSTPEPVGPLQMLLGIPFALMLGLLGASMLSLPAMLLIAFPVAVVAGPRLHGSGLLRALAVGGGIGLLSGVCIAMMIRNVDMIVAPAAGALYGIVTAFFVTRMVHG